MRKQMIRRSKWFNLVRLAFYAGISSVLCISCSSNSFENMVVAVVVLTMEQS